ncbi:MAG TPA: PGPGW domain-containing protein [Candidatus Sulfotelmatobacter sp.]|jgi:uncharacterized protein YqgC (DUF456 family)|nr:PGPGW domain-containing protein [Candidatus Sulfotelmatobacter sp.]
MSVPRRARRVGEWILGCALIAVGVVGLVLPGIQGILLIVAGLAVLSRQSPLAKRLYDAVRARAAAVGERLRRR